MRTKLTCLALLPLLGGARALAGEAAALAPTAAGFLEACVADFPRYAGVHYLRNYSGCVGLAALGPDTKVARDQIAGRVRQELAGELGARTLRAHFAAHPADAVVLSEACEVAEGKEQRVCGFLAGPRVFPVRDQLDMVDPATEAVELALVRVGPAADREARPPAALRLSCREPSCAALSLADVLPAGAENPARNQGYQWFVVDRLALDTNENGLPHFTLSLATVVPP